MRYLIGILLAFAFISPAAASKQCYGVAEKALAQEMLVTVPKLRQKLLSEERQAKALRRETCAMMAVIGYLIEIDYALSFYQDVAFRSTVVAAQALDLHPLRVHAALVDALWPVKRYA